MPRHVLIVLKSKQCGHCQKLTKTWPSYQARIDQGKFDLQIEQIDLETLSSSIDPKYPASLSVLRSWVPNFALISRKEWDEAIKTKSYQFKHINVFNGQFIDGRLTYTRKYNQMNEDAIIDWIKDGLSHPEFSQNVAPTGKPAVSLSSLLPHTSSSSTASNVSPQSSSFQTIVKTPPLPFGSKIPGADLCTIRLHPR